MIGKLSASIAIDSNFDFASVIPSRAVNNGYFNFDVFASNSSCLLVDTGEDTSRFFNFLGADNIGYSSGLELWYFSTMNYGYAVDVVSANFNFGQNGVDVQTKFNTDNDYVFAMEVYRNGGNIYIIPYWRMFSFETNNSGKLNNTLYFALVVDDSSTTTSALSVYSSLNLPAYADVFSSNTLNSKPLE